MAETSTPGFVIAVCGPSGAGKTTVIEILSALLGDAVPLRFDDYEESTVFPELKHWLEEGADPNQFQSPQFLADLRSLRAGEAIQHPVTQQMVASARFILLEEPFGRERDQLRQWIDLVVYIDVPLEIALIRQILRKTPFLPWEQDPETFIHHLRDFLSWYMQVGRAAYLSMLPRVMKNCDLLIDGTQPAEKIAEEIYAAVSARQT